MKYIKYNTNELQGYMQIGSGTDHGPHNQFLKSIPLLVDILKKANS